MMAGAFLEEQQRCFDSGMDDYLARPVRPQDLLAALERNVAARGEGRPIPTQEAWPEGVAKTLSGLALGSGDDGHEFVSETVRLFLEGTGSGLAELEAAVRAGDAPKAGFIAHGLKGTSWISAPGDSARRCGPSRRSSGTV